MRGRGRRPVCRRWVLRDVADGDTLPAASLGRSCSTAAADLQRPGGIERRQGNLPVSDHLNVRSKAKQKPAFVCPGKVETRHACKTTKVDAIEDLMTYSK